MRHSTCAESGLPCAHVGAGRRRLHETPPFGYSERTDMHTIDLYRVMSVCR